MFKIIIFISINFFLFSCGDLDFIHKEDANLSNPIYNKTIVKFTGLDIPVIYGYSTRYFGNNNLSYYELTIDIQENKTKRAVQTNQAVSKLDYKIVFNYNLKDITKKCDVYSQKTISRFSYEPKSSGYNFGSDQSLRKLYELSSKDNLQQFISHLRGMDLSNCK